MAIFVQGCNIFVVYFFGICAELLENSFYLANFVLIWPIIIDLVAKSLHMYSLITRLINVWSRRLNFGH